MTDTDLPDAITKLFAQRQAARNSAVIQALTALTERERLLVKEAAVMGWVQGTRHHDLKIPGDRKILATVTDACLAMPNLYPTIANYQPEAKD